MDDMKKAAADAVAKSGEALDHAAEIGKQGVVLAAGAASQALDEGQKVWERSKGYLDQALDWAKQREDEGRAVVKDGMAWVAANPHIAYPAATGAALVILPGTRRMLYRATFARLVSLDSVSASSRERLSGLSSRVEEFGQQAEKLQAQAAAAEDEWRRSYQRLRSSRSELQRLAAQVGKSEKQARGVLDTLRLHKRAPDAVELRADAAQKVAALKQQRASLEKSVYRIARMDI